MKNLLHHRLIWLTLLGVVGCANATLVAPSPASTAVELPYDGNQLSMVLVIPEVGGLDALESSMTAERADEIVKGLGEQEVVLTMPKWKFDSGFQPRAQ